MHIGVTRCHTVSRGALELYLVFFGWGSAYTLPLSQGETSGLVHNMPGMSFNRCTGHPSIIISTFFFQDYKTMGRMIPTLDARQDYTLLNASEAGGYTQLIFERPRDTGDENDFAFMVSERKELRGKELDFKLCWLSGNVRLTESRKLTTSRALKRFSVPLFLFTMFLRSHFRRLSTHFQDCNQ